MSADLGKLTAEILADLRSSMDRAFLGFDPAPRPDRSVLAVVVPARDVNIVADLERMRAMMPRPIDVVVVPNSWIEDPLRLVGTPSFPDTFIVRRGHMDRLRDVVDPPLGEPFSGARVIEIPEYVPAVIAGRRHPRSRGWRKHVRRTKAAERKQAR